MKNILTGIAFTIIILSGCSTGSDKTKTVDTMNGISNTDRLLDTQTSAPQPDGYAPPNTKIDTSQQRKDSIKARKQ